MKEKEDWYGSTMETEPQKILDPASGKPVILRQFRFQYAPWQKTKPKKKEILTEGYIKHLENTLWADNLEMIMHPRVTFTKQGFSVFAACTPKKGNRIPSQFADTLSAPLHTRLQEEEKNNG